MSAAASQITSIKIVYSTVYSGSDERKYQSSASLTLCEGNSPETGEFPAQRVTDVENVSIWWRHYVTQKWHDFTVLFLIIMLIGRVLNTGHKKKKNSDIPLCLTQRIQKISSFITNRSESETSLT